MGLQKLDSVESPKEVSSSDCADWAPTSTLRQPILADEVQTFKALITVHKVLQEGHPVVVKEAQANINWLESLTRGVSAEGARGAFRSGATVVLE